MNEPFRTWNYSRRPDLGDIQNVELIQMILYLVLHNAKSTMYFKIEISQGKK